MPDFDKSFRQGTLAFMAADLVESPIIPQTFHHDLESFFWVLLWIVLTQMKTSWAEAKRSAFLKSTFKPELYERSGGVTGGEAKINFLKYIPLNDFQIPGNTILTELVKGLKDTVSSRFDEEPSRDDSEDEEDYQRRLKKFKDRSKLMKGHSKMLDQFASALDPSKKWPENDEASPQTLQLSIEEACAMQYSTKRSRSMYEGNAVSSSSKRRQA
jgi:hypothetical protein